MSIGEINSRTPEEIIRDEAWEKFRQEQEQKGLKVGPKPPPPRRRRKPVSEDDQKELKRLRAGLGVESVEAKEKKEKEMVERVLKESGVYVFNARFPAELYAIETGGVHPADTNGYLDGRVGLKSNLKGRLPVSPLMAIKGCRDQIGGNEEDLMNTHDVHEFVDIRHLKDEIIKETKVPAKKLLWMELEPAHTKKERTGKFKSFNCSELVPNGKNEPTIAFTYAYANELGYRDEGKRSKVFRVTFMIPESVAGDLEKMVDQDPRVMRKLVEKAMTEKILKDKNSWTERVVEEKKLATGQIQRNVCDPLRPNWERDDKDANGGRVYVQKEGRARGWQDQNIRQIKK